MNRAHGPTKENKQFLGNFWIFPAHAKNGPRWAQIGSGGFFHTNPDLANILGRTDLDFENFYFLVFFCISNFQISRTQISKKKISLGPGLGPAGLGLGSKARQLGEAEAGPKWVGPGDR